MTVTASKALSILKRVLRSPVSLRIICSQTGLTPTEARRLIGMLKLPAKKKAGKR